MSIEDVIARSEQSAKLTERLRFSVAKTHAIEKLRQFALADPAFYILELIQSAIANGATYLDITLRSDIVRVSWVGGGFSPGELRSLFDFLFTNKDNLDLADVRQLALGVNALMGRQPNEIVIESGDGTLEGTSRVEVDMRRDDVAVGTPAQPLNGTFVVARWSLRHTPRDELRVIEERCLTAPIPLLLNDELLFGYSAVRSPDIFGCRRTIKFDEGDLYGTLGLATTPITRAIKLLTWGTWIASVTHDFEGLPDIGGVVGFDRLRKTADHANVVNDEVYEELWLRLLPYARQLVSGSEVTLFDVALLSGVAVTPREVRELGVEAGRIIMFLKEDVQTPHEQALARRFQELLAAPVLLAAKAEHDQIRLMANAQFVVLAPQLDEQHLRFLERPIDALPPMPWLAGVVSVPGLTVAMLRKHTQNQFASSCLAFCTAVGADVYTPAVGNASGHTVVELRNEQRLLATVEVLGLFPGHVVVAELSGFPVARLLNATTNELALAIAEAVVQVAQPQLEAAANDAIHSNSDNAMAQRHLRLAAIARHASLRLRRVEGVVRLQFAMDSADDPYDPDMHPLITMANGEDVTLNELARRIVHTEGLVLATRAPTADLPAAPENVVHADEATMLIVRRLVGDLSFVDLDVLRRGGTFALPVPHSAAQLFRLERTLRSDDPSDGLRQIIYNLAEGVIEPSLEATPLLRTGRGTAYSFEQIRQRFARGGVHMFDGAPRAFEQLPLAADTDGALAVDSFIFRQLSKLGEVAPILDFDLDSVTEHLLGAVESKDDDITGIVGFPRKASGDAVVIWTDRNTGVTRTLQTHHRLVGRVVTQGVDEDYLLMRLFNQGSTALQTVTTIATQRATDWEVALRVLLDYCGQQLDVKRRGDGTLEFTCFDSEANRLLALPLVMTREHTAVSIWSCLHDIATYGSHDIAGRIELGEENVPMLQQWLRQVVDVPADPLPERELRGGEHALPELEAWLNELFAKLRPDEHAEFTLKLQSGVHDSEVLLIRESIFLNADGPLMQAVLATTGQTRAEAVAWLMLGVYAHINALLEPITNDHELQFQARVLDWLALENAG